MSNESSLIVRFSSLGSAEMLAALDGTIAKGTTAELVAQAFGNAQERAAKQLMMNTVALEAQVAVYRDPAYEQVIERYKRLREEMTKLSAPTRTLTGEMENFTSKVENNILALKAQISVLQTEAGAAQMAEQSLLKAQLKSIVSPNPEMLGPGRQDIPVSELEKVTSSYRAQNEQLRARLDFFKDPANKQAIEDQRAMKRELDDMNEKAMPGLLSGWSRWSILMLGITAAFAGLHMVESIVDAAAVYEQLNVRLVAIDGSADVAAVRLAKLQTIAKQPGIGLEEATKGYTALRALNETGTESINILTALAKANSAMGGGKEEFGRAIVQIEQMIGKGKIMGEDIRSLSNSLPNFRGLMVEAFGTVDTKVLNSKYTINEFLRGIEEAANKLKAPTSSIKNDFDNISDGWLRLKASMLDTGFIKSATSYLGELLDKMASMAEQRPGSQTDRAQHEMYTKITRGATYNPLFIGNDEGTLKVWKQAGEYVKKAREDAEALKSAEEAAAAKERDALELKRRAEDEYAKHQKERDRLHLEAIKREQEEIKNRQALELEFIKEQESIIARHEAMKEKQADALKRVLTETQKEVSPKDAVETRYQSRMQTLDKTADILPLGARIAAGLQIQEARDRELALIEQKDAEARAKLLAGLKTEEELIAASYEKRRLEILNATQLTESDKLAMLKKNAELEVQEQSRLTEKRVSMLTSANSQLVGAIADSFKMAQGEQSAAYKAMFVTSKAFLVADAGLKIANASAEALRLPWPTNIAALAQVSANGAVIISQMNAIAGAFDAGGFIPAGKKGIAGENGLELIEGPARVTSSRQTADLLASRSSSAPVVNIHNYAGAAVSVSEGPNGDSLEVIIEKVAAATENKLASSITRGSGPLNNAIKTTYGLSRNV